MAISMQEYINDKEEQQRLSLENFSANIRVAIPCIVKKFDETKQTITAQPTIREFIRGEWLYLPLLLDVPIAIPKSGGYAITFPIKEGDECLVVFSDTCIDGWWQNGNVQNQIELRRHDLSDAIAIIGISSIPNIVENYSMTSVSIRNKDNSCFIEITDNETINIKSEKVLNLESLGGLNIYTKGALDIKSETSINLTAPEIRIEEKPKN